MYNDGIELRPPTLKEIKYMFENGILKRNNCWYTDYAELRNNQTDYVWLNDRSILGKQLVYDRYKDKTHTVDKDSVAGLLPVIPATTDLIDVFKDGKLPLGMFPTNLVDDNIHKELCDHLRAGDLLVTERFYGKAPMFQYKGKYYLFVDVPFNKDFKYEIEADSSGFDSLHVLQYNFLFDNCRKTAYPQWYEVENLYFKYIKDLNVFVYDKVLLNINYYKGLDLKHSYNRMTEDILSSPLGLPSHFGTINDYVNFKDIRVLQTNDTNCFTDFACLYMPKREFKYKIEMDIPGKIDVFGKDSLNFKHINLSNNNNCILYGEYPQTEIKNANLHGEKTGKQYSLMNANGGIELIDEYIDLTLGIKYVKVYLDFRDKYYKVEPIEWKAKYNKITSTKVLFNVIGRDKALKFIAFCFKKEIIPSKVKTNVHEVINSNIGYQLLMNKNNINESDLELDDENKLVFKK